MLSSASVDSLVVHLFQECMEHLSGNVSLVQGKAREVVSLLSVYLSCCTFPEFLPNQVFSVWSVLNDAENVLHSQGNDAWVAAVSHHGESLAYETQTMTA